MTGPAPVRLAVVGCGWIAGLRLAQLNARDDAGELAEVVALVDPSAEACEAMRGQAPRARVVDDLSRLDPDWIDGVMVSTPSAMHAAQAVTLLCRGLPVFVQKPLGISGDEVAGVLSVAAEQDLPVATDFCYRRLCSVQALRHQLDLGTIGAPYHLEACFHNAYRPDAGWSEDRSLAGGGALMDLGIHLIDLVGYVMDAGVSLREADLRIRGRPWTGDGVEDFARLDLLLDDEVPARIVVSWDASVGQQARIALTVHGDQGTLELGNRDGSFFDFGLRRHFGTWTDELARDDGDRWQVGALVRWLRRLEAGAGYEDPVEARRAAALVDAAYAAAAPAAARRPKRSASVSVIHPPEREHLS